MTAPLHVVDQCDEQTSPAMLAYLADRLHEQGLEPGPHVLLLGGSALQRHAEQVGIHSPHRVNRSSELGRFAISSVRPTLYRASVGRMVHVWSLTAARLIERCDLPGMQHLHFVTPPAVLRFGRLREPLLNAWQVHTHSTVLREQLIAAGVCGDRISADPAPSLSRMAERVTVDRAAARAAWRVREDEPVVAVLSDPPTAADTMHAGLSVSLIADAIDCRPRLVVHPQQTQRARYQRLLRMRHTGYQLIQDARLASPWLILPGCDAALLGPHPAPLAARYAVAAGIPIVAPDLPYHREALGDYDRVAWVSSTEPKRLADRLHHWALASQLAPS